jgi:hypothetical protein
MVKKMLSPKLHGIADWGFVAGLFLIPKLLKVNSKARKFYNVLGSNILAVNGFTDHGVSIKPLISVKTHETLDVIDVALLYGLFGAKMIRKDKKALGFHLGLTALATANVLLTDYDAKSNQ